MLMKLTITCALASLLSTTTHAQDVLPDYWGITPKTIYEQSKAEHELAAKLRAQAQDMTVTKRRIDTLLQSKFGAQKASGFSVDYAAGESNVPPRTGPVRTYPDNPAGMVYYAVSPTQACKLLLPDSNPTADQILDCYSRSK